MTMALPETLEGLTIAAERPELYAASIPTESGDVSVYELWQRFDDSQYGLHMDTQPLRFSHSFAFDRESMIRQLGTDVVPRMHQYETGLYAAWLLQAERAAGTMYGLSDEAAAVTVFAAAIHDLGETTHPSVEAVVGRTIGDIEFGRKTPEDRLTETAVRKFLYDELYADVAPAVMTKVEDIIAHRDETMQHEVFEIAHNLQTHVTGTRARVAFERGLTRLLDFTASDTDHVDGLSMRQLGMLQSEVGTSIGSHIEDHAKTYEFANRVLRLSRAAIKAAASGTNTAYYAYRQSVQL